LRRPSPWPAGAALHLDKAPDVQGDKAALQSGARTFVNYCLNCHGASFVRYNRLTELGLTEQQVKDNLMFTADKIGEPMRVAARPDEQKVWFGAAPPDLSLIARARASADGSGADWLYTYLRSFYVDEKRPTGWNNTVFANVGMPHVLWQLQGDR
jgi:ubiquinol-cytochrome c reductase cytochrome c1 subunit